VNGINNIMQKKEIQNRASNLLTEYWNGNLPVNLNKIIEALNVIVKKDMMFDSSGLVTIEKEGISCKINVMDPEEKHRFAIACAVGYTELNSDNMEEGFTFDVIKDYNQDAGEEDPIWQAVKFAHYMLMPEEAVRKEVEKGNKQGIIPSFSHLYYSKEFKVPQEVVKERFEELGIS
jgi:Zn-dependent peptidase ImmA (M78 family)